ncbi:MAG TPA: hypothetical protein VFQ27_04970, partial [Xanthobacteraceae bacterium]|nr:hypothetical protein [Xanthobacteraceae bacterium]
MKKLFLASASLLALSASGALAAGSSSYVNQEGDTQQATIDQTAATNGEVGTSGNPFDQKGSGNIISITQSGSGNKFSAEAVPSTIGSFTVPPPVGGFSDWQQNGTGNVVTVLQSGTEGHAGLYQEGDNNSGTISQGAGSTDAIAAVANIGNGNAFSVGQDGGDDNIAAIGQVGDSNVASVSQTGNDNIAGIGQIADFSNANVTQNGDGNLVLFGQFVGGSAPNSNLLNSTQTGNNNRLWGYQSGDNNVIGNTQTGGAHALIIQTNTGGGLNQINNNQDGPVTANLTQTGFLLTINNTQSGSGFSTLSQSGNNHTVSVSQNNGGSITSTQTG